MGTIIGTPGNNPALDGTNDADTILGLGGSDTMNGSGGDDVIIPGSGGSDAIDGGSGKDVLVLNGSHNDYSISFVGGNLIVSNGTTVETIVGVETVAFDDVAYRIVGAGSEYGTIQSAIDAASAGNTILVAAGTYTETINVNKQVSIVGQGDATIINGGVDINASGADATHRVAVKDVKITNSAGDGVDIGDHDFITLSGVTIEGMPGFSHAVDINFVGDANDIRIEGSTFNLAAGQVGRKIADAAAVTNLQVVDSTFNGGQYGFYFANDTAGSGDTVTGTFSGLDFIGQSNVGGDGFRGMGIYAEKLSDATLTDIDVAAPASGSNLNIRGINLNLKNGSFENISLSDVDLTGFDAVQSLSAYNPLVVVAVKPGASLDGLTLNDITGAKNAASTGNGGIVVDVFHEAYPSQIADLIITNSALTGVVKIQTSDYTSITGNSVTGDLQLVLVDQPASPGNSLAGNTVSGTISFSDGRDAVLPDGADNLTLFNGTLIGAPNNNQSGTGNADANVITGNDGANVLVGGGGDDSITGGAGNDTAPMSGNWQDAQISVSGGRVVVTTAAGGTDSLGGVENIVFGNATVWLVDPAGVNGATNLSAAVAGAAAGDVIYLLDGTHLLGTSTLNIDKQLTILGQSEAGVIIDASGIDGYGILVTADGSSLSNFTLNGPAAGGASGN